MDSNFEQLQFKKTLSKRQISEIKWGLKEQKFKTFYLKNWNHSYKEQRNTTLQSKAKLIFFPQQRDIFTLI